MNSVVLAALIAVLLALTIAGLVRAKAPIGRDRPWRNSHGPRMAHELKTRRGTWGHAIGRWANRAAAFIAMAVIVMAAFCVKQQNP
jgi:hypothetical protein